MIQAHYSIAVLPGDGIGPEVMAAALGVVEEAVRKGGRTLRTRSYPAGAHHFLVTGESLPARTLAACRSADATLLGAMGLPHVRGADGAEIIPQLDLRCALDLYAGVRPVRTWPGLPVPLADPRATEIDLVLVRENTEGLYHARGRSTSDADSVVDPMRVTRAGTARVADFALALARKRKTQGRPGHLTNVDKADVFKSMVFWRSVVHQRAEAFPEIVLEDSYVDAMASSLVLRPWKYDVLVMENLLGDILSALTTSLTGGEGMAPTADIGDRHALFQPAHGPASDIAGRGIANPTAVILSAAMMLDWLSERHADPALADAAQAIEAAVRATFAGGKALPYEFGGTSNTADMAKAVLENL